MIKKKLPKKKLPVTPPRSKTTSKTSKKEIGKFEGSTKKIGKFQGVNPLRPVRKRRKANGRPIKCKYCAHQFRLSKRQKVEWKKNNYPCPSCQIDLCCLPDSERSLMKLQSHYFATGRESKVLGQMYDILKPYASSLIKKKHTYITDPNELMQAAHLSAWYLLEHYYNDQNFRINISFGAYLKHTIKQAIFDREEKKTVSLDIENEDSKKIFELASDKDVIKEVELKSDHIKLATYMRDFIFAMSDYSNSPFEEYQRLLGLRIFFTLGERNADRFYQRFDRVGKPVFDTTLVVMRDELHKLHSGD